MHKAKRRKLSSSDFDNSLRLRNVEVSIFCTFCKKVCVWCTIMLYVNVYNSVQWTTLFIIVLTLLSIVKEDRWAQLTFSHPEGLLWRVKSSGVRQSKITKCPLLAGLGEKGLKQQLLFTLVRKVWAAGAFIDEMTMFTWLFHLVITSCCKVT